MMKKPSAPRGAWDSNWDKVFASRPWGRYPPEELVAFCSRTFGHAASRHEVRVLEIGCGPGGNLWYLAREGFCVSGIDGSTVAIDQAGAALAADLLKADLRTGDMAALPYPDGSFDAVVDVAALQHNRLCDQHRILAEVHRVLVLGGVFFSLLLARGSWGDGTGQEIEPGTYTDITDGPGAGCGIVRFTAEEGLPDLFKSFNSFTYERRYRTYEERQKVMTNFIVTAAR